MTRGLHLIFLYADTDQEWNCSEWRALTPSNAINAEHAAGRCPHTAQLFYLPSALDWRNPEVQSRLALADVLIFQRNIIIPEVYEAMDYWRALGKTVVVDLDDHYPGLPGSNPAHHYWIRNAPGLFPSPIEALAEGLRHADALASPSKVILEDWNHILPGLWLPNYCARANYENLPSKPLGGPDIEFTYAHDENKKPVLQMTARPESEGLIILGWGGSISHVDSWLYSGIVDALDKIFEKHPHARLKFCGHENRLDTLFLNRWGDKVIRQSGVQPGDWPKVVATFDIGLAPLDTRPLEPWREGAPVASYDERRSWLKGVEYLCAGMPWVATDCLTYTDLRKWGKLVKNTPAAWYTELDRMITNLKTEKDKAQDRRRWALKKMTMEGNANNYIETIARTGAFKGAPLPGVAYVS